MRAALISRLAAGGLCLLAAAAPAQAVAPAPAPLTVKVGEAADLSRIEFHWAGPVGVSSRREAQTLIVRFSRNGAADFSRLRVDPPRFLKTTAIIQTGRGLELRFELAADADAKVGQADGATYVNLFARKAPPAAAADGAAADGAKPTVTVSDAQAPNPVPASGVVQVQASHVGGQLLLRFPWKAPLGAAVFRRGDAVWAVFDAPAKLDISSLRSQAELHGAQIAPGDGVTALRLGVPGGVPVAASAEGATWTLAIGIGNQPSAAVVQIGRDAQASAPTLAAAVAGATKVAWIHDPVVGDRLGVVTARAPSKGLPLRRDFIEMAALPSAQGLAVERAPDDLTITSDGDTVRFSRPGGLKLSPGLGKLAQAPDASAPDLPRAASMPALVDSANWSKTGPGGFNARYAQLLSLASAETTGADKGGGGGGIAGRMALARFLVGSELDYEAIGLLNMLARSHQEVLGNAEFRGLRGAAAVMAGRYKEALVDFSAPVLVDEPSSAMWRGYANAKLGHWKDARDEFSSGQRAESLFAPMWRARFARASAEAALGMGDREGAKAALIAAAAQPQPFDDQLHLRLLQARYIEAKGHPELALPIYRALANVPPDEIATVATLHATQLGLAAGKVSPAQAAQAFDGLRYRWRGDAVELQVIRALGQLYLDQGRYREALETLRSAGARLPDLPEAVQLQADLQAAFRALFLQGQADGLQPVQALALFFDFKEQTPVGADGDEMVRKLAQRLVNVDLLDQAAALLKYQADNRLDGVPRAIVSTDEALINVMARKPEDALEALNSSRTTLLPPSLNSQRRIIEARAWLQLNQPDHASEILGTDTSSDAQAMRAEISWRRKDWANAAKMYEVALGHRFDTTALPLSPDEEQTLLRSAIAYSLASDDAALARLRGRYSPFVEGSRQPDALRVALAGSADFPLSAATFAKAASDDETFQTWVARMKQQLRQRGPAPAPATLRTAQAGGTQAQG